MTNILDEDLDDLIYEDDWEDDDAIEHIQAKYPDYIIVKITNFTAKTFEEIEEWLSIYAKDKWEKVGWSSGCSYTVGIAFHSKRDAFKFKLTW